MRSGCAPLRVVSVLLGSVLLLAACQQAQPSPTPRAAEPPKPAAPAASPAAGASPSPAAAASPSPSPAAALSGTIKIVSSLPRTGSSKGQSDTMVNAFKMALDEANNKVGGATIVYDDMDDATPARGAWDAGKEAE